jgi:hypothetical protein
MKNLKGYIIGTVLGASLMFSTQGFAAVGDKIEAIYADFNVIVKGNVVSLDETPIVVNGKSYLPVRTIARTLGYKVTYASDTRTIEFTPQNNEVSAVSPTPTPQILNSNDTVFYSYADIFNDLNKGVNPTLPQMKYKDSTFYINYNGKSFPTTNGVNYFFDNDSELVFISKSFFLQYFQEDYLSKFDKYTIDFAKKTSTKIN